MTTKARDVTDTLDPALIKSGLDQINADFRLRLLSDNGASYISGNLGEWLDHRKSDISAARPIILRHRGKIERWHQTLKNRIHRNNSSLLRDLEGQISTTVDDLTTSARMRARTTSRQLMSTTEVERKF